MWLFANRESPLFLNKGGGLKGFMSINLNLADIGYERKRKMKVAKTAFKYRIFKDKTNNNTD